MLAFCQVVLAALGLYSIFSTIMLGIRLGKVEKPAPLSPQYVERLQGLRSRTSNKLGTALTSRRFLIIGGTGFTGTVIADDLVARGAQHVRVMSRIGRPTIYSPVPSVEYVKGSMGNISSLHEAMKDVNVVIHAAAYYGSPSHGQFGSEDKLKTWDINVGGMERILAACEATRSVELLIYISSTNVIFDYTHRENVRDSSPYVTDIAKDHYTKAKIAAEDLCLKADGKRGFRTVALRPVGIYGPQENLFMPKIVKTSLVFGCWYYMSLEQRSDWVYVYNLAWANNLVVAKLESNSGSSFGGKAYSITDGDLVNTAGWEPFVPSLQRLGVKVKHIVKIPPKFLIAFSSYSELFLHHLRDSGVVDIKPFLTEAEAYRATRNHSFSIERAYEDLGYTPLFNSKEGFDIMAEEVSRRYAPALSN